MNEIQIAEASRKKNTLAYIGSVDNVIKGIVPEGLKNRRFSASEVKYGFELGSPQGIFNMGECVVMNGLLYSSRTDATRSERDPLMWGPEFVTSGIFLVPADCEENFKVSYCSLERSLPLRSIYSEIYSRTGAPFAIAGCAELALLRSRSITYSPIEKENIFLNEKKYYTEDEHRDPNISISFVGVVSDFESDREKEINDKLKTVLYYNPYNRQGEGLISHSHAATLTNPIVDIAEVRPHHVKDVIHLMDDSLVRYLKADIFLIDDIAEHA
ncbi:MAG: hypothetical protein WCS65_00960 [Verrucomicrobiae bacterium]